MGEFWSGLNSYKEVYYSPSQNKTYIGKLPIGVEGEFSPEIKSLVYTMKHVSNMSESKIHEFLGNFGIHISPATISRILTKNNELFDQEKDDIVLAGISSTRYQQIDDTSGRVKGQNQFVQILWSNRGTELLLHPLLRTERATFTALRSSISQPELRAAICEE